LSNELVK